MARPRKQQSEKLDKHLPAVRCTGDEHAAIRAKAAQAGLSLSAFVRAAALAQEVSTASEQSVYDLGLVMELNRIGVNLNQIARVTNSTGFVPSEVAQTCKKIDAILDQILETENLD